MQYFRLNYSGKAIGIAFFDLEGDLRVATLLQDVKIIKAHWALAARIFRARKNTSDSFADHPGALEAKIRLYDYYLDKADNILAAKFMEFEIKE